MCHDWTCSKIESFDHLVGDSKNAEREGRSLIPELPLNSKEAELGLAFFEEMRLPGGGQTAHARGGGPANKCVRQLWITDLGGAAAERC
jgi:hypothetical protein